MIEDTVSSIHLFIVDRVFNFNFVMVYTVSTFIVIKVDTYLPYINNIFVDKVSTFYLIMVDTVSTFTATKINTVYTIINWKVNTVSGKKYL